MTRTAHAVRAAVLAGVLGVALASCATGPPATQQAGGGRGSGDRPVMTWSGSSGAVVIGPGATLPADWPAVVRVPDGFEVVAALRSGQGPRAGWLATFQADGDRSADATRYVSALRESGFRTTADLPGGSGGVVRLTGKGRELTVASSVSATSTTLIVSARPLA